MGKHFNFHTQISCYLRKLRYFFERKFTRKRNT